MRANHSLPTVAILVSGHSHLFPRAIDRVLTFKPLVLLA
jgi:hypothetical protein